MVNDVVVLGGGSAGFLAAITIKTRLPALRVTVVRSRDIGIIGVGEGTTVLVPAHLHRYLGIPRADFYAVARPTWKLGIRFLWGPRPRFNYTFTHQFDSKFKALPKHNGFYCRERLDYADLASALMHFDRCFVRRPDGLPLITDDYAYHVENADLVAFLEQRAAALGVRIVDDTVVEVTQDARGVSGLRLAGGPTETGDLYVDCSGFASVLLGGALGEPFVSFKDTLFCDRAVVGGWKRGPAEPIKPYTTAETMQSGWCWQIEHEHRVNRGYVYSSPFVSDEDAEREFRAANPAVESTRVVRFVSGRYARAWVKNVVAVGNAGGFVEPLESTSLSVICDESQGIAEALLDSDRRPSDADANQFNRRNAQVWDSIRRFLAIHFRFNTRLDTPFWRECREKVDLADAKEFVDFYLENGPSVLWRDTLIHPLDLFQFEGYLTLMVGQRVPYRRAYEPSPREMEVWDASLRPYGAAARAGFTVEEALALVRSPQWRWDLVGG